MPVAVEINLGILYRSYFFLTLDIFWLVFGVINPLTLMAHMYTKWEFHATVWRHCYIYLYIG